MVGLTYREPCHCLPNLLTHTETKKHVYHFKLTHSANGPWKKSLNFIFPTKHVIRKSLKFSHWLSELNHLPETKSPSSHKSGTTFLMLGIDDLQGPFSSFSPSVWTVFTYPPLATADGGPTLARRSLPYASEFYSRMYGVFIAGLMIRVPNVGPYDRYKWRELNPLKVGWFHPSETYLFSATYRGPITPSITGRGPPCTKCTK